MHTMRFFRFNYNAKFMFGIKVSQFYMRSRRQIFVRIKHNTENEQCKTEIQGDWGRESGKMETKIEGDQRIMYMWDVFIGASSVLMYFGWVMLSLSPQHKPNHVLYRDKSIPMWNQQIYSNFCGIKASINVKMWKIFHDGFEIWFLIKHLLRQ